MSKVCSVEGCNGKHNAKGYCDKHYRQFKKYGHILERTVYDKNEIIEYEDYAEIILYDKDCIEIARAIIDLEDVERVKEHKWYLNNEGYTKCSNPNILLHRFIINAPDDMVVDHINRNRLDNRKCNLRDCTAQQNCMNRNIPCNNASGTIGVSKEGNTWRASITINGRRIQKRVKTKEEAITLRRQWEIDYFGEFSPSNAPDEPVI